MHRKRRGFDADANVDHRDDIAADDASADASTEVHTHRCMGAADVSGDLQREHQGNQGATHFVVVLCIVAAGPATSPKNDSAGEPTDIESGVVGRRCWSLRVGTLVA
jgi:hypothetical protein